MSTMVPQHDVVARARRSRLRRELANLDYLRDVAEASSQGVTQTEIARRLGVTQPAIMKTLRAAASAPAVPAGFHGGSPREIAERFAAGELTREQVVDELARWPHRPGASGDGVDWSSSDPGEWNEHLVPAWHEGLIDDEVYVEVQRRRDELAR